MATTEQRLAEYEDLFRKSQQYDPNKYKTEFEKAYGEATNYNQDLIEQQARALGEVQAVAPTLRERYMNTLITDPTAQMALIAQARQAPITSYGTAANLLTARGQRYEDILGKALGGYQTAADQANIAAENAWRLYQDAVQQEQFQQQLRRSGGGGGGISVGDIKRILEGGQGGAKGGEVYDIETTGGVKPLGNTFEDRLAKEVLNARQQQGAGDVLKSYLSMAATPFKDIKTFSDVLAIPSRAVATNYAQVVDLYNRLFKK